MKNIEAKIEDKHFLVLRIDLDKVYGRSKSGKTTIVASTEGNPPISALCSDIDDKYGDQYLGLNQYKK